MPSLLSKTHAVPLAIIASIATEHARGSVWHSARTPWRFRETENCANRNGALGSLMMRFANNFHEWRSHKWKSLATRIMSDPKIVIHGNKYIISFLTHYFMSWTHNSVQNNYRCLILPLLLTTIFSDLALWSHRSQSIMSRKHGVLALWHFIRQLFFHAQIGAKVIFTCE